MEMEVAKNKKTDIKEGFLSSLKENLPAFEEEGHSGALRSQAKPYSDSIPVPQSKVERWKYTRVNKVLNKDYVLSEKQDHSGLDISPFDIPELNVNKVVLVNGHFSEELSEIEEQDGVFISSLNKGEEEFPEVYERHFGKHADYSEEFFTALNSVFFNGGIFIHVDKNVLLNKPIHLLEINTGENLFNNHRSLIHIRHGAEGKLIHSTVSVNADTVFNNTVNEIVVHKNAKFSYDKLQNETGNKIYRINTDQIYQEKDSDFRINTVTLNGDLVRNDLNIDSAEQNTTSRLYGLYFLNDKQHVDNHTLVHHKVPNCYSEEHYKGILDDSSTGVFNGKVFVHRDAQQIDAYQSNNNILLSDDATIHSKPELEIYADDVSCSHGSTTGQLDDEAFFYLQSRGISEKQALNLLLHAFSSEILNNIETESVRSHFEEKVSEKFNLTDG